jgi:hypothetical protein
MRVKSLLLCGIALFAAALPPVAAHAQAQSSTDFDKIDQMQRQMQQLQEQIKALKNDMAQTKKKAEQNAKVNAAAVQNAYGADIPVSMPTKAPSALPAGLKLSWGGFIEAAGIWRERNEVADVGSDFNNIPYPISPLNHENELRFSARQSRLWFMAEGDLSMTQIMRAYFEMDFLGAATTANSIESNSYTPRIRQAFLSYDDATYGWHAVAGQAWSLLTQNKGPGIMARQENIPLTIDAQYVVGFNWTRNAQFRVVKDVAPGVAIGASAESPQVRFQTPGSGTPPGLTIDSTNLGTQSGLMDTLQGYSIDEVPDFIEKIAFDPGWGHYEVVGLQRFFNDRVLCAAAAGITLGTCTTPLGTASNHDTFGWGVGGSMLLPAVPKLVDLQGSVLYGQGIGRYGSGQLPDVTFGPNGQLSPVTALQALVGAVGHLNPALDVYVYAGAEQDQANFATVGGTPFGLGNPAYLDSTCFNESFATPAASANGAPGNAVTGLLSNTGCSVNVKRLAEITAGFWYNFYNGPLGRLTGGAEFEYIHRDTFAATLAPGVLVSPPTDEAVVMTSVRYYFP